MADHGNITTPNAADLDTAARKYAASQGWAMPDGSYPIRPLDNHGQADLEKAIHAVGRGNASHDAIRAHIMRRASALGLSKMIPEGWHGDHSVSMRNIEWRAAAIDDVNRKQRIITVVAVPYDEEGPALYRGELWNEVHRRGAYRGLDLSAGRVPINVEHDPKIQLGKAASIDTEHPTGLISRMKISDRGDMGERYLDLAADDAVSASVGFYLKSYADQRLHRRNMLREINRAFLDHIALVGQPAFTGAKVLSVASDGQQKTTADLPRLVTPHLDAVLSDEMFQWAASETRQ